MRRLALLGGSLAALVAAAVATLRGRRRGKAGKVAGRGGKRRTGVGARRKGVGAHGRAASGETSAGVGATPRSAPPGSGEAKPGETAESPRVDDLRSIKGIGAVMADRLRDGGITSLRQVAAWSEDDIQAVADRLGIKAERIVREDWVGQARSLGEGQDI
jgi:predicted flap endonuclease-1-like 5' DNA nuclease